MRAIRRIAAAVGAIVWLTAAPAAAQTTSTTSETKKFEVIAVDGNTLVVRLPEGTRELTVADDFRFTVDGKPLSVRELRPGMAGTATITTKTTVTPVTVTEIKEGTVAHVAGSTIMVRTPDGVRSFTQSEIDKRGIKIVRGGKPAQLSEFRAGDRLSATIITTKPPTVVTEREVQASLAAAGGGAASPAAAAARTPTATGTTASGGSSTRKLPKTASAQALITLLGLASLAAGAVLTIRRRHRAQ